MTLLPKMIALSISASVGAVGLAVAETAGSVSNFTPELVAAIFLGLTGLLTAAGNLWATNRANRVQKEMKANLGEVHDAVNGANTALVETVARMAERLADFTKDPGDRAVADAAETAAVNKRALQAIALAHANRKEIAESRKSE